MPATTLLIDQDEPHPVEIRNPGGPSPFLILCDHAGRRIPRQLGDLGVSPNDMERHIAWDIGCEAVSIELAATLDAMLISQRYSRLVIDCNRTPGHSTSIPPISEQTPIPGNVNLTESQTSARRQEIFDPYHTAIATEIDRRGPAPCVIIAMHSFTPVYAGIVRPWEAGILYDRTPAFSLAVGAQLRQAGLLVGDNEPYQLTDESDYTVPIHAERRGLPYVELEIRQDLIAEAKGQHRWAAYLAKALPAAWSEQNANNTNKP